MKLHLLRYFCALAEELHFGRAAQRLSITQPPLSSGIKVLEAELGVQLFERSSKHVALTPAGHAYLAEVRVALAQLERAGETARATAAGQRGRLDVGFTSSMAYRDLPRIVHAFGRHAPGIEVRLCEMSSNDQVEALLRRHHGQKLHAGFINVATVPAPLDSVALAQDYLVCCLPESHTLAQQSSVDLRALACESFVMFARDVAPANHDNVIALFHRAGIHPQTRHAARQWLTVVALVAQGLGVALVPASAARAGIHGVRFVPITGLHHPTAGVLAWHTADTPASLQAFVAVTRACLHTSAPVTPP